MQRAGTFVQTSTEQLRRHSGFLLRVSLAVVFIWFGALKVVGASPVDRLVLDALPLVDGRWFLPLLGVFEVGIGTGRARCRRAVLLAAALVTYGQTGPNPRPRPASPPDLTGRVRETQSG